MGKYIIVEDEAKALAQMYVLLKKTNHDKEFLLVKCDYNHNCAEDEVDNYHKKEIQEFIKEEINRNSKLGFDNSIIQKDMEHIIVIKTKEELLQINSRDNVAKEDILILDITLFEREEGQNDDSFANYASVRYADALVEQKKISAERVRFYTKFSITTDSVTFNKDTKGKWYVPVLRPRNISLPGSEEENKIFVRRLLRGEGV